MGTAKAAVESWYRGMAAVVEQEHDSLNLSFPFDCDKVFIAVQSPGNSVRILWIPRDNLADSEKVITKNFVLRHASD